MLIKLQACADAKGLITGDVSVDSTVARGHQHTAGAGHDAGRPAPITARAGHAAD